MGRHSTTRSRTHRTANALALVAACGLWGGTMAITAPQPIEGQAHAAAYVEHTNTELPKALKADRFACWAEKVHGDITDVEIICGDKGDRPRTDTADIGQTIYPIADPLDGGREPWVVTATGLEPVGDN